MDPGSNAKELIAFLMNTHVLPIRAICRQSSAVSNLEAFDRSLVLAANVFETFPVTFVRLSSAPNVRCVQPYGPVCITWAALQHSTLLCGEAYIMGVKAA
jgi:hypothetical protein